MTKKLTLFSENFQSCTVVDVWTDQPMQNVSNQIYSLWHFSPVMKNDVQRISLRMNGWMNEAIGKWDNNHDSWTTFRLNFSCIRFPCAQPLRQNKVKWANSENKYGKNKWNTKSHFDSTCGKHVFIRSGIRDGAYSILCNYFTRSMRKLFPHRNPIDMIKRYDRSISYKSMDEK